MQQICSEEWFSDVKASSVKSPQLQEFNILLNCHGEKSNSVTRVGVMPIEAVFIFGQVTTFRHCISAGNTNLECPQLNLAFA